MVIALVGVGLIILYSAGNQSTAFLSNQLLRLGIAFIIMIVFAQIPPRKYYKAIPYIFVLGLGLLVTADIIGHIGKGAQRWLSLGVVRFQPSEIMKLAAPMMIAWYLHDKVLPPTTKVLIVSAMFLMIPFVLVAKQPDLGTAILIGAAGGSVLLLAGLGWRLIAVTTVLLLTSLPILWYVMYDYQRLRVLTFLNPERDPLGSGYHIIQSKIAIGSGGVFGKGWLHGTQSHLQFLPEHATDFIFAVCGEEFGFIGCMILMTMLLAIVGRGLYISSQAQDTFSRLLAGSISLMFFICFFVNIGMVSGILPVVGIPLPLVSYGGTSMVTLMAGFGILMSIHTHRQLIRR
ncbi:MAG: rod shape-determining protein RodA [Pseudomonadota bacterium]|nr:rod shape-determining protein RodA [Pseudomonadota bacterium]